MVYTVWRYTHSHQDVLFTASGKEQTNDAHITLATSPDAASEMCVSCVYTYR